MGAVDPEIGAVFHGGVGFDDDFVALGLFESAFVDSVGYMAVTTYQRRR